MKKFDLLEIPYLKAMLRSRWPQFLVTLIALAGFLFAVMAGWLGTPVGSRNFAIIFVWIAWWALLMLVAVPVLGRGWCSICPIPMPGEWLQRGAVLGPLGAGGKGLKRRWPRPLRNIWLQNLAFTIVALFSIVVLTQPQVTAIVLAAFLFIAVGASLIFERRAFCRYLCPVGGFIGLYAQLAPVELRVKDSAVCAGHTEKTCYTGNQDGYGCPWQVFPGGLTKNTYCGTCMECLRTCPYDNIAINLRPVGADLAVKSGRRMDEAIKAFIMLASAMAYAAVLQGPWGALKSAAYNIGSLDWLLYACAFLIFVYGLVPGLFYLAVWLGKTLARSRQPTRREFTRFAYALVPLGLTAWIAFSLSFVFTNLSYLWSVLSDPLGWGWNLVGTAGIAWTPYLTHMLPGLQAVVLLAGMLWAGITAKRIARESLPARAGVIQATPVMIFCLAITLGLMLLLFG
ncbi:MAG TPA: 4Fe-4S binding protein [Anaerolineales bacterium]